MPETEHRGYKIIYAENEEVWRCYALDLDAPKLSTLKGKIDRMVRKINDQNGVPIIYLNDYRTYIEGLAVGVLPGRPTYNFEAMKHLPGPLRIEWMGKRHTERVQRNTGEIGQFALDTPEVRAMLAEFDRLTAAAVQAQKKADDYKGTIPRLTEADVAGLKPDEDDEAA